MPAGTIDLTNGSNKVSGSGTSFSAELKAGDFMYVNVGGAPYTIVASAVVSDIEITLTEAFTGPSSTGLSWNSVPALLQMAITQKVINDFAQVARGRILDFENWQGIYSDEPSVTVTRPDRTQFTGPSWGHIAKVVGAVEDPLKNLVPLSRQYMTVASAQADIANIPEGSATYVRSQDDNSLADEYINNGGTLVATGRKMPSQYSIDGRVYLSDGSDLTKVTAAGKTVLMQDELGRLYLAGMESSVQEVLDRTDETNNSSVHLNRDSAGNVVLLQDENGQLYAPGLNGSVQDAFARIHRKINNNRSPYLNVMPDSMEAVWQRVDEFGHLYLPGMPSGLQTQLNRNTERLRELANNRQVYDARDFGLRSEQGDRNEYIINGAINAAARNGGGVVYIPPGNWGLLNYITPRPGVSIIGAGTGATILRPRGSYAAIQRLPDDDSYLSDCVFQDFAIDGSEQILIGGTTYDSRIKGFYFFFFKRCFFNRLLIQNTGATGLGVDYAYDSVMTNITTENCGRLAPAGQAGASGIGIGTGGSLDEPLYIGGTFNRNNRNFGIFGEWARRENSKNHSRYSIYVNNVCTGNGMAGIGDCGLDGLVCIGNDLTNNAGYGFLQDTGTMDVVDGRPAPGSRGILMANNISRNGKSGIGYEGSVVAGSGYHYKDNIINDNAEFGIEITAGSLEYNDVWIFGNEMARNGRDGLRLASGTMKNVDIEHNRIFNNGQDTPNGGGSGLVINGNITGGSITSNKLRDNQDTRTQDYGLCGNGNLVDVDIDGNHYVGFKTAAENLTGTKTNVTYGRNPGKE
ncbi:right-handed parallel beta-helix repeat-containing protein [Rahnella sp. GSA61A]|uniref:right-handed parallel beta-helix repeat-containing protein n=2 Tax=Rahnella TaxID=34037 RepID=UPI001CBB46E3|nr:right-handed parallel beta-helix repeat-containing protein [Rahnella sp. GSA61A]